MYCSVQMLDQPPDSSLAKVSWKDVIQMAEQVSKHATTGPFPLLFFPSEGCGFKLNYQFNMKSKENVIKRFIFFMFVCVTLVNMVNCIAVFAVWQRFSSSIFNGNWLSHLWLIRLFNIYLRVNRVQGWMTRYCLFKWYWVLKLSWGVKHYYFVVPSCIWWRECMPESDWNFYKVYA